MSVGRGALALVLVLALPLPGCGPGAPAPAPAPVPTAASEWPATHVRALTDAREARLASADRALVEFARRFAGSPEAQEVPYWRALYKLDPNDPAASREAVAFLDEYLAASPNGLHRAEAILMRRLAAALEARATVAAVQPATPVPRPEDKAQVEELQRLRDELAKANAELTRIKRRLARPKP